MAAAVLEGVVQFEDRWVVQALEDFDLSIDYSLFEVFLRKTCLGYDFYCEDFFGGEVGAETDLTDEARTDWVFLQTVLRKETTLAEGGVEGKLMVTSCVGSAATG